MEQDAKVEKYEEFVANVLQPDLQRVLGDRDKLYEAIAAHSQLKQTIKCMQQVPTTDGLRTQVDLGCNFYVQAHVPDSSFIYVNVGLGFHPQLTHEEALRFLDKKLEMLNKQVKESSEKSAKIKADIKFVLEAIRELQILDVSEKSKSK